MKRKLSAIAILGLVLSGLSASPAQATPLDVNGNGTVLCSSSGSFAVTNFVVVSHSNCAGHAEIPAGVTGISLGPSSSFGFSGASSLTSVTIPNTVTTLGPRAFLGATSLSSVTFPNSVTSIGDDAFEGASALTSLTIPNSITTINRDAFRGLTSLTSLTIPDSVTTIRSGAFRGLTSLTSLTIPDSVTNIGNQTFQNAEKLTSLTIGSGVTSIGNQAFEDMFSLTSLTIPSSVTSIGDYAFSYATALPAVTFLGSAPTATGQYRQIFFGLPTGAQARVNRAHIGSGPGKFGAIGSTWDFLIVAVATSTLSLNSEGSITTQAIEENGAPTSPQLSRAGFTLQGWSATEGGTPSFAADLSNFTMGPTATSLFAVWESVPVIVENASAEEETPVTRFSGPLLSGFDKRSITQDAPTSITFRGIRLNLVLSATIDGVPVVIESSSRSELTIAIEAMKPGTYTLVLQSRSGSMTLSRFLVVR